MSINEMVAQFEIDRSTVHDHIDRAGIRRRYPALAPPEVERAIELYGAGKSLAAIATHLAVHATTVRRALLDVGVEMRDCQGRVR